MGHFRYRAIIFFSMMILLAGVGLQVSARPAQQTGNCVLTGTAFRDFNADGTRGTFEPGVPGITVTAFGTGGIIQSVTTGADGSYTLNLLPAGSEVRLEFTGLPDYLRYGPAGSGSSTSVAFVTCDTGVPPVDIGLANPGQHCDLTPDILTTCFALGDPNGPNADEPVIVQAAYTAGSTDLTTQPVGTRFDGGSTYLAIAQELGSVWGLAYRRQTDTLYAASYLKRHVAFQVDGPGAIYALAPGGGISTLTVLPAAAPGEQLHTDGTAYPDRPFINPWLIDSESYALVGTRSLGDMTMSEDDNTLYVINLFDRSLYAVPVDNPGARTSVPLPTNLPNCAAVDARPFAVEQQDGRIYVGITCTAESTQNRSQLAAYVYSAPVGSASFSLELSVPLTYPRRCIDAASDPVFCLANFPADWQPWISGFDTNQIYVDIAGDQVFTAYPQPLLTDIEFDNNGDMILAFRDRFGDQMGNASYSIIDNDLRNYTGLIAGDILRACQTTPGTWSLESNATCGSFTTGGANNGEGPGGGEYYFEDNLVAFHDEDGMGSALQIPGQSTVVGTFFDPIPINTELGDAGLRWLDNRTGQTTQAYRIYNGEIFNPSTFAKANGLGGMEARCPIAPIEIGNRIWFDTDRDGVQDPGETPLAGVTVRLYDANGNLIAETVTNANGEYLFTSRLNNLRFNTDYVIRLDNPADYADGGPLFNTFLTANNTSEGQRDSDGVLFNGFPTINMNTGAPGDNNHTYDFGFIDEEPTPTPTPSPTPTDTPTPGGTPPPGSTLTPGVPGGTPSGSFIVVDNLVLEKSVNPPFAQGGAIAVWTIRVSNNSAAAVSDIVITDTVPNGLEVISTATSRGTLTQNGRQITVQIGTLSPGQQVTITIRTRVGTGANIPLVYDNLAVSSNGSQDSARLVIANELVATGEVPWWRSPALVVGLGLLTAAATYLLLRRQTA
jgi:uncharacterized repeat protein (TIGR01451 family)